MSCTHKTIADHSVLRGARRVWTCSACGRTGHWSPTWRYHGNLECVACGTAWINTVACSSGCEKKLRSAAKSTPANGPT